MPGDYDEFVQAVMADVLAEGGERARHSVAAYYDLTTPYTGSAFEALADRDHPDRITASDMVAVSTLSVSISRIAARRDQPGEGACWHYP